MSYLSKCWEKQAQALNPSLACMASCCFAYSCNHTSCPESPRLPSLPAPYVTCPNNPHPSPPANSSSNPLHRRMVGSKSMHQASHLPGLCTATRTA